MDGRLDWRLNCWRLLILGLGRRWHIIVGRGRRWQWLRLLLGGIRKNKGRIFKFIDFIIFKLSNCISLLIIIEHIRRLLAHSLSVAARPGFGHKSRRHQKYSVRGHSPTGHYGTQRWPQRARLVAEHSRKRAVEPERVLAVVGMALDGPECGKRGGGFLSQI